MPALWDTDRRALLVARALVRCCSDGFDPQRWTNEVVGLGDRGGDVGAPDTGDGASRSRTPQTLTFVSRRGRIPSMALRRA